MGGVDPAVYLLSAIAALFFGLGPVSSKRGLASGGTWMSNALVVLTTRTGLFWVALLATGSAASVGEFTPTVAVLFLLGGVLASGVGRLVFYVGVDRVGSSVCSAVSNTRPLFAVALAVLWLGERVTSGMAVGVLVLVAGLVVLSLSRGGDVGGWARAELLVPLLAAMLFALGNVVRRLGFTLAPVDLLAAVTLGETGALAVLAGYAAVTGRLLTPLPSRARAYFVVDGVLAGVGLLAMFGALRIGPVSVVDPMTAVAPLFTVAFAAILLRDVERVTRGLFAGVALVVVGVALLTVG